MSSISPAISTAAPGAPVKSWVTVRVVMPQSSALLSYVRRVKPSSAIGGP
jgi:hypothetical protein